uniref:Uncharacterized protein n=1 Tax=Anguilla anguilla TaxID=7936 RepID=A0A0E9P592_ANGAN
MLLPALGLKEEIIRKTAKPGFESTFVLTFTLKVNLSLEA